VNQSLWDLVATTTTVWTADPDSGIVWAGEFEGRRGVRIVQNCREATTIWFATGDLTLRLDAYLFGRLDDAELHRRFLKYNYASWPISVALDRREDIYLTGRIPVAAVDENMLGVIIGGVHDGVERLFPHCLEVVQRGRETSH
jgi:putative sensory transduction regulator